MQVSLKIPGSKSLTNRALILATLGKGTTKIKNAAICDDVSFMVANLKKLGVKVKQDQDQITITGTAGKFKKFKNEINLDTGNAGTTTRFLTALSSITANKVKIDGDERMRERPISALTKALNSIGASIETSSDCPPLRIGARPPLGGELKIPGDISSQYLSALLMIAASLKNGITLKPTTEPHSKPYIDITLNLLKKFGIKFQNKNYREITVKPQKIKNPKTILIESDASSASYPSAFCILNPGLTLKLENISKDSIQGDIKFFGTLKKMGAKIEFKKNQTTIKGPKSLKNVGTIDMNDIPDMVMTLGVLAAFTKGKTQITNIENLRIKETDRIEALKNELKKLGVKAKTTSSSITIENPACVSKSYVTFWEDLEKLERANKNIVFTGLRGSGKTKLSKMLSEKLKMPLIDLDKEIEKKERKKINKIVAEKGWKHFRKIEKEMTVKFANERRCSIISTGGGTILDPENEEALKRTGLIIYLHRKPETCAKMILDEKNRPRLTEEKSLVDEMKILYKERRKIYRSSAHYTFKRTEDLKKDAKALQKLILSNEQN